MKTALKRTVLVVSLFGASSLIAYGGPGFFSHHSSRHSGMAGHMLGASYGPGAFVDADLDFRLKKIRSTLSIRSEQEAAWNDYASSIKANAANARSMHETCWPQRRTANVEERDRMREFLWQQHQSAEVAARSLFDALDEQQRSMGTDLIGYGMQHYW